MQLESPNLVLETHLFQGQKVKGQDQSQKSPKTVTVLVFVLLWVLASSLLLLLFIIIIIHYYY